MKKAKTNQSTKSRVAARQNAFTLITGATGFVGRHLAAHLAEKGRRLRILARSGSDLSVLPEGVDVFTGDITDPASLKGIADNVNEVFHVACAAPGTFAAGKDDEKAFFSVNRDGTGNLLNEMYRHFDNRIPCAFVHLSSTAAMGAVRETVVDESTPCRPASPYQRSKRAAELLLLESHGRKPFPLRIVRSCLVAGEGKDKSEFISMFRLIKNGLFPILDGRDNLRKPMISVYDLVEALRLASENGRDGETYLVTSGTPYTLRELIKTTGEVMGRTTKGLNLPSGLLRIAATLGETLAAFTSINPPITHARIELYMRDRDIVIDKAVRELGFKPSHTDLYEMLYETWKYHHERGDI